MATPFIGPLLTVLLALIIGIGVSRRLSRNGTSFSDAVKTFQDVLTAMAIIIAGYWYFVERKAEPHADLSQAVTVTAIDDKHKFAAVEATISIKNIGDELLKVDFVDVRLQTFDIGPEKSAAIESLPMDTWPSMLDGTKLFSDSELQWPVKRWFHEAVDNRIEPGETDAITATFIVACDVPNVRIATSVRKDPVQFLWYKPDPEYWKIRTTASTADVCHPKKGK